MNRHKNLEQNTSNKVLQYIMHTIHPVHVTFIPGTQGWFNIHKSINVIYHINKLKNENHVTILIDAKKPFDKIQQNFMLKTLSNVGI